MSLNKLPEPLLTLPSWIPAGKYHGVVKSFHDGDTCKLLLFLEVSGRLENIQAPELRGPESARAAKAQQRATAITDSKVVLVTLGGGYKYGEHGERMVTIDVDGVDVGEQLIREGLAVAWDGRGPRPVGEEAPTLLTESATCRTTPPSRSSLQ